MDKKDWEAGYDWVVETIKLDHEYLASKMEIEKALNYLKTKEFDKVNTSFLWRLAKVGVVPCYDAAPECKRCSTDIARALNTAPGGCWASLVHLIPNLNTLRSTREHYL